MGNTAHPLSRAIYHFDQAASEFVISGPKTSYNIGRILSYTLAGVAAGALSGSVFDPDFAQEGPSVLRVIASLATSSQPFMTPRWP